jgi:hypothetical protein
MARNAAQLSLFDIHSPAVPKIGDAPPALTIGTLVRVAGDDREMRIGGIVACLYGYTVDTLGHGSDDACTPERAERFHARGWSGTWVCEDGATPYTGLLFFCHGAAVYCHRRAEQLLPV